MQYSRRAQQVFEGMASRWEEGWLLRSLEERDFPRLLELYQSNPFYNSVALEEPPSLAMCREDQTALPPGTSAGQKLFLGLFQGEWLQAVLDLVDGYPEEGTLYIGLLELHGRAQRKGLGTRIMAALLPAAAQAGFSQVRLGCMEQNQPGLAFWRGQGFAPEGSVEQNGRWIVKMQKEL